MFHSLFRSNSFRMIVNKHFGEKIYSFIGAEMSVFIGDALLPRLFGVTKLAKNKVKNGILSKI